MEVDDCPITAILALIGGRWKPLIIYQLTFGTRRFGEIAVRIPAVSRKVLTDHLKELERDGLVVRKQYKEIPPRVEYSLTELGRSLSVVIDGMAEWGNKHLSKQRAHSSEQKKAPAAAVGA